MMRAIMWVVVAVLSFSALFSINRFAGDDEDPAWVRAGRYLMFGDLVSNEAMARAVAEGIVRGKYGEQALKDTQPMTVRDNGAFWFVFGRTRPNPLSLSMRISRRDGQVTQFFYSEWDGPDCRCGAGEVHSPTR